MGQILNSGRINDESDSIAYQDMTPLQKAKADMDYYRHKGGIAYKQAKRRYEKLMRRSTNA